MSSKAPGKKRPGFRPTSRIKPQTLKAPANVAAVEPPEPVATTTNTEPKQNQEELEKAPAANEENSSTLQHDSSLVETSVENVAVPPVIPATKPKQPIPSSRAGAPSLLKRGRKRKKTGVEVGISLPSLIQKGHPDQEINHDQDEYAPALEGTTASAGQNKARSRSAQSPTSKTNNNNNNQDLATRDELAIPEDTSGLPSLNSFCSKFRSKRKKKEKTGPATETPIAAVEEILNVASAGPVVQVINGEIVLQESSMVVSGNSRPEEEFPVIEEESHLAVVGASYNSFVSRRAPQHWTVEETSLFYDALRQVGTDFGTMEAYFGQQRTRKQLKRKYQLESTKNPQLIDMALDPSSQKQIDLSVFKVTVDMTKKPASVEAPADPSKTSEDAASTPSTDDPPGSPQPEVVEEVAELAHVTEPEPVVEEEPLWPDEEEPVVEEPLWPDEEEPMEPVNDDPFMQEEVAVEQDAPSGISLVPKAASSKAKTKKPNFRSRMKKK